MHLIKTAITILAGMSLLACPSKPSSEANTHTVDSTAQTVLKPQSVADLEKQVLTVHDSVMPAMSDLMKLKKEVAQQLSELDKQTASANVRERVAQGQAIKAALDQADRSMMDWMHHYNGDTLASLDEQQALTYLKAEQQRVNAMSQLMRKSITDAQTYLKSR